MIPVVENSKDEELYGSFCRRVCETYIFYRFWIVLEEYEVLPINVLTL